MSGQGYQIKQQPARTAENMARMQGDTTLQVARKMLADIPKFASGSVVHDNACGNAVITQAIMETQDVNHVDKIHATDILPTMCEATQKVVEAGPPGWAAKTETGVMPCEELKFADDTFTHSFAGFVLHSAKDSDKAASEMYRTMKSGASGFVTTWGRMPHQEAIIKAHEATRSADSKHPLTFMAKWSDPNFIQKELEKAGFSVKMSQIDTVLSFDDTKDWCALAWGFMGAPVGGWSKEDEDRFDEAVDAMAKDLQASELFTANGKGGQVKMVANLATVHKK